MGRPLQFGTGSFADLSRDDRAEVVSHAQAIRATLAETVLAVIGGPPDRFVPFVDLYRRACEELGTNVGPVGMHAPGFVADTDEEAKELLYPGNQVIRDRIGALRGWPPLRRSEFEAEVKDASSDVGSVETVAREIARAVRTLGVGRFDMIYSALGTTSNVELAEGLGLETTEDGSLRTDAHQATSAPGLYAAGDVVLGLNQIAVATSEAARAATAIHNRLREADGLTLG